MRSRNPTGTRQHIGLGPPPSSGLPHHPSHSAAHNPPSTPFGQRAASFPAPYHGPPISNHPDLAAMFAAMSLQQTRIIEQNQALREENTVLAGRVAAVESATLRSQLRNDQPEDHVDGRVQAAARKKKAAKKPRRERLIEPAPDPHPPAPGSGSPAVPLGSQLVYLGDDNLSPKALEARKAAQRLTTKTFRDVCNVTASDDWPDPSIVRTNDITGTQYLTPRFYYNVAQADNHHLLFTVAQRVYEELQDPDLRPAAFASLAKKSFNSMKTQWRRQNNPEIAAKAALSDQANRQRQRRVLLYRKKTITRAFAAKFNLDRVALEGALHEAYESDEASGPDLESDESHETWKLCMAAQNGLSVTSRDTLAKLQFVEVLKPEWRSDALSNLSHALQKFWFSTLTAREQATIKYIRVRGTGRSSPRIPDYAPWNFAISAPWLEVNRLVPENTITLSDWNTHGNPPGLDLTFLAQCSDPGFFDNVTNTIIANTDSAADDTVADDSAAPGWYVDEVARLGVATTSGEAAN
ncbi:hypothetical protein B0H14DRAFT_2902032 [Mycena olivaceomarginata]|nr:hypothetical protein B0H14DRAFT_2902032 [Mycena olivaceomarginata]